MKKVTAATAIATVMALALVLAVSCTQTEHFGYVSFDRRPKDIIASIAYPAPESQVWTVTATKADNGGRTGEGTYSGVLLTDVLGPFSVGRWSFAFGSENYSGTTTVRISEGENHVDATVSPKGETGTLLFTGCNIEPTSNDFLFISVDGEQSALCPLYRYRLGHRPKNDRNYGDSDGDFDSDDEDGVISPSEESDGNTGVSEGGIA